MSIIRRRLTELADILYARGLRNKHDLSWIDLIEEEYAYWLVEKFKNECGYADLLERKPLASEADND